MKFNILLLSIILISNLNLLGNEKVKIGIFKYEPYHINEKSGLLNDLYKALFNSVNIEVEFVMLSPKRAELELLTGKIDMVSAHFLIQKKNHPLIFKMHIYNVIAALFYFPENHDNKTFNSLKEIKGKKTGIIFNSAFKKIYEKNDISVQEIKDPSSMLEMAILKRIDFFEAAGLSGGYLLKKSKILKKANFFVFINPDEGPAILKSNKRYEMIKSKLIKGYNKILKNGVYYKVIEKYWGIGNVPKDVLPSKIKIKGIKSPILSKIPLR
ncbi:MAG: hypothetical protein COA79_07700 [Planctomycetota bacterium]|nr:MAG: hypothetical protein COA79_07700 [Planctomycetota bacterium]